MNPISVESAKEFYGPSAKTLRDYYEKLANEARRLGLPNAKDFEGLYKAYAMQYAEAIA